VTCTTFVNPTEATPTR